MFLAAGARVGVLQLDGVRVSIESSDEQAILAAALALRPMPTY